MKPYLLIVFLLLFQHVHAQQSNVEIKVGNDAYLKGDYKTAAEMYKKVLTREPNNLIAKFNLGNALIKQQDALSAEKYYDEVAMIETDPSIRSKALYNKGVAEIRAQKLIEAIDAFKKSLLLDPDDDQTRENLQKALNDLKQQQQQNSPQQKKQNKQKQQPKKQQTSPEMMEQKFNELQDKEKQLQKMLQRKPVNNQPEKDW